MNKQELHFLLKKYHITPRREHGQNFLLDEEVVADTVRAAELTEQDTVLEIGPGFGVLTMQLAQSAGRVVVVEQDEQLFKAVSTLAKQFPTISAFRSDITRFHMDAALLPERKYKLVANLPYNITSWVLKHFYTNGPQPSMIVVMVQKEVAERVTAQPGEMSILSCAVQLYGTPEIVRLVSRSSFYPAPAVDSAILKISTHSQPLVDYPEDCMRLIRIGFSARRKQLHNNLAAGLHLAHEVIQSAFEKTHIDTLARPQELTLGQWIDLYQQLARHLK